jgi:hypothetical protein
MEAEEVVSMEVEEAPFMAEEAAAFMVGADFIGVRAEDFVAEAPTAARGLLAEEETSTEAGAFEGRRFRAIMARAAVHTGGAVDRTACPGEPLALGEAAISTRLEIVCRVFDPRSAMASGIRSAALVISRVSVKDPIPDALPTQASLLAASEVPVVVGTLLARQTAPRPEARPVSSAGAPAQPRFRDRLQCTAVLVSSTRIWAPPLSAIRLLPARASVTSRPDRPLPTRGSHRTRPCWVACASIPLAASTEPPPLATEGSWVADSHGTGLRSVGLTDPASDGAALVGEAEDGVATAGAGVLAGEDGASASDGRIGAGTGDLAGPWAGVLGGTTLGGTILIGTRHGRRIATTQIATTQITRTMCTPVCGHTAPVCGMTTTHLEAT